MRKAASLPYWSTCTLWSITRSAGTSGLMRDGSPPISATASRMAARSTTHGTPVKSCRMTRPGMNGSSTSPEADGSQDARARMSSADTSPSLPAAWRSAFSSSTLTVYGSVARSVAPAASSR